MPKNVSSWKFADPPGTVGLKETKPMRAETRVVTGWKLKMIVQFEGTKTNTRQFRMTFKELVGVGKLRTSVNRPKLSVVVELAAPLQDALTLAPDKRGLAKTGEGFEQVRPNVAENIRAWTIGVSRLAFVTDATMAKTTAMATIA